MTMGSQIQVVGLVSEDNTAQVAAASRHQGTPLTKTQRLHPDMILGHVKPSRPVLKQGDTLVRVGQRARWS
jgi:hypothetical protein